MDSNDFSKAKVIGVIVTLFIILILIIAYFPVVIVGAGQRGVVFNNFSGIENRVLDEGTHFRNPFVESVHIMPIKVQKSDFSENTASKDLQQITMDVSVNWQLNPARVNKIYQTIGDKDTVVATVLNNRVQEAVKANVSQYSAEEVQKNREKLTGQIETLLSTKVKQYDIIIDSVSITNLNYTTEFNQAIENKQLAQQDAEKASYLKQKAENEAAATIAKANGDASAIKINADAQSYANDKLQQSLTPDLLQKMLIERWSGNYPQYMLGGSVPLLQLPAK